MRIGLLKEPAFESRVALTPEVVKALIDKGLELQVEHGAGLLASYGDADYEAVGASLGSRDEVIKAEVLVRIQPLSTESFDKLHQGQLVFGMYQPLVNAFRMQKLAELGVSCISMDAVPRITRAQSMDVLSSQASLAGYQAVLRAATLLPRIFPMMMTAAGTIAPAKVLVIGAGVAGLQAVATAKRLGAVVEAFDTRPSVKEQVESLGGRFVEVPGAVEDKGAGGYAVEQSEEYKKRQSEELEKRIVAADVVISTALIPGRQAPILITRAMVERMRAGSVIVDLAAAAGGNCELTQNNETITELGITIVGNGNLPAEKPQDASRMYAKNMLNFLTPCLKDAKVVLNLEDEIIKGSLITHAGALVWEPLKK
ncbi:MAG: Re/Si-specific NAD(P)(+) transhydrogenase subunit alpha [Bacteroidia bacterium]